MAATATRTGDVQIPESMRREKTVATCDICKRNFSAKDLDRHHARRVIVGSKPTVRWECFGHEGRASAPVSLSGAGDQSGATKYRPDLSAAKTVNERIAKAAPDLVKARAENDITIERLTRIAGSVGGEQLDALRARCGLKADATPDLLLRTWLKAIGDRFVEMAGYDEIDTVPLGTLIAESRMSFRQIEQAFGFDAGDGE